MVLKVLELWDMVCWNGSSRYTCNIHGFLVPYALCLCFPFFFFALFNSGDYSITNWSLLFVSTLA